MTVETRSLGKNAFLGTEDLFHYDHADGSIAIETLQDAEPLIERNKALFNDAPKSWGEGKLVASIPMPIYMDLVKRGITKDKPAFRRWLNDPDNRVFRTRPGHL